MRCQELESLQERLKAHMSASDAGMAVLLTNAIVTLQTSILTTGQYSYLGIPKAPEQPEG